MSKKQPRWHKVPKAPPRLEEIKGLLEQLREELVAEQERTVQKMEIALEMGKGMQEKQRIMAEMAKKAK
jgi:arsenate reductase-like glutaredoxin family protein